MKAAKDTAVSRLPDGTCYGQDIGCNATVAWWCVQDGVDDTLAVFGRHPEDDDFSLYLVDDANDRRVLHAGRQIVLSRKVALEFAQTILEIYKDAP